MLVCEGVLGVSGTECTHVCVCKYWHACACAGVKVISVREARAGWLSHTMGNFLALLALLDFTLQSENEFLQEYNRLQCGMKVFGIVSFLPFTSACASERSASAKPCAVQCSASAKPSAVQGQKQARLK